jgi:hypothetical protein
LSAQNLLFTRKKKGEARLYLSPFFLSVIKEKEMSGRIDKIVPKNKKKL